MIRNLISVATIMALVASLAILLASPAFAACPTTQPTAVALPAASPAAPSIQPWLGVHVMVASSADLQKVRRSIPPLARLGVNALIVEVNYHFDFRSHPELRGAGPVTRAQARDFANLCRQNGIRVIPQLNCLGHQSWTKTTHALLEQHPDLDETPGQYPGNKGIYCRSWCPLNPDVNAIVFPLLDELIDAFAADAFHVGMDEVLIIASKHCPRCRGKDPADLFAKQVNDLHQHLVKRRGVQMLMWGDRLLDARAMGIASHEEASKNGTPPAIDKIPNDIILCDWHYNLDPQYKSIPYLLSKGFRVWPSGWHDTQAADALIDYALAQHDRRMIGYLSTTWHKAVLDGLDAFPATKLAAQRFVPAAASGKRTPSQSASTPTAPSPPNP